MRGCCVRCCSDRPRSSAGYALSAAPACSIRPLRRQRRRGFS
ncbi:hypothetical protein [Lysobacter gummosus]